MNDNQIRNKRQIGPTETLSKAVSKESVFIPNII